MAVRGPSGGDYAPDWDLFVASCPGDNLVQTAAWANSKRRLGFLTRNVVLRENGAIVDGASIIIKRFGPLGAVGYVARGPLLGRADRALAARLVDALEEAARAAHIWHLIVQPPEGGASVEVELAERGYTSDVAQSPSPSATVRLDLADGLDHLLTTMSRSKRYAVRRSTAELREGAREAVPVFHELHKRTAERQRFTPLSLDYLFHKWDCLGTQGMLRLVIAYADDQPFAGLLVSTFGDHVTARLAGWTGEHPRQFANEACDWWAVRCASEQGRRYYDLGGVDRRLAETRSAAPDETDESARQIGPELSAARYKLAFGGAVVLLPVARQRTLRARARPLVKLANDALLRSRSLRRLAHAIRNG